MKAKRISRLLDLWSPPQDAGEPIGCLATTYTFDSEFFEEECLARFVKMESDPFDDGPVYLIEREDKFSGIKAAVMVDQNHCKGKRSLRWDLIPFRHHSLLHAKISILYWSNHLRIMIGSANISKSGYRYNQEIVGLLDFNKDADIPESVLQPIIGFLKDIASKSGNRPDQPEMVKWNALLDRIWEKRNQFTINNYAGNKDLRVYPLFIQPGNGNLFDQLSTIWINSAGRTPRQAYITSPFFDETNPNKPSEAIWKVLAQKGESKVTYNLIVNSIDIKEKQVSVNAPQSICFKPTSRAQVSVDFEQIAEESKIESKVFRRPVHQKSIRLEEDDWCLYLMGSSNFTSAGTGLSGKSNFEANLAYIISSKRNKKGYEELIKSCPETYRLGKITGWRQIPNEDEETAKESAVLPMGFISASFDLLRGRQIIRLTFDPGKLPDGFVIYTEKGTFFYSQETWEEKGRKVMDEVIWKEAFLPSGLIVKWNKSELPAWWPINIISQLSLPVPEELRQLPLEVLLHILSASRPVYQSIRKFLKKNESINHEQIAELDALKRVNTYDFLLQRTRRISYALNTMKCKLEKPVYTIESLHWRLYGPVGVNALCEAIQDEAKSTEEKLFLLAEIALELSEIEPIVNENSLSKDVIRNEINKMIMNIHNTARSGIKQLKLKSLDLYLTDTFKKAENDY